MITIGWQILCLSSLLGALRGSIWPIDRQQHDEATLYRSIGCTAACMVRKQEIESCYAHCSHGHAAPLSRLIDCDESIQLKCRDYNRVYLQVRPNRSESNISSCRRRHEATLLLIRLTAEGLSNSSDRYFLSIAEAFVINGLRSNATYTVSVTSFNANHGYYSLPDGLTFDVFPALYRPAKLNPDHFSLEFMRNVQPGSSLIASLKWKPSDDLLCSYIVRWYSVGSGHQAKDHHSLRHWTMPENGTTFSIADNPFEWDSSYNIVIYGSNSLHMAIEGEKSTATINTPTCHKLNTVGSKLCPPLPPANVRSTHRAIENNYYFIRVWWDAPAEEPDYYQVTIRWKQGLCYASKNTTGHHNWIEFAGVNISDAHYSILVEAISPAGLDSFDLENISLSDTIIAHFQDNYAAATLKNVAILLTFVALFTWMLIYSVIRSRRGKYLQHNVVYTKELQLRELADAHNKDSMEINLEDLELYDVLGEGAFGVVRRGILKSIDRPVAVKMLKDQACVDDKEGFLREISLMKSVGQHENIVGIVGHSTIKFDRMMLLTEYCSEGNLLNYLKNFRHQYATRRSAKGRLTPKFAEDIINFDLVACTVPAELLNVCGKNNRCSSAASCDHEKCSMLSCTDVDCGAVQMQREVSAIECNARLETNVDPLADQQCPPNQLMVENRSYDIVSAHNRPACKNSASVSANFPADQSNRPLDDVTNICGSDLLRFAKQIANGMMFLANNKIVHRDLAARNVLVCIDKTVKISDFGLSRDIYLDNIYMKTSAGRLPIKWLAIESMSSRQEYTSQSDVWSYGILLYELVTMGGTPYPSVPVECLLNYLDAGSRMAKPANCCHEFYNLMCSCWQRHPEQRPSFAEILQAMDGFLASAHPNGIIRIDQIVATDAHDEPSSVNLASDASYLNPFLS